MNRYRINLRQATLLIIISLICLIALSLTKQWTKNQIEHNERAWFEAQLNVLIPATLHNNTLLNDRAFVADINDLSPTNQLSVYRARLDGAPTAAVIHAITPDGYNGPIELLVAVDYSGMVLGVRILNHHETPNMGDEFSQPQSRWLEKFEHRSLTDPDTRGWNIRKDGGDFEQFTSATITPRAIIHAIQRTLDYYQRHRDLIFQTPGSP